MLLARMGVTASASAAGRASLADFVLEGLCAMKKISRTEAARSKGRPRSGRRAARGGHRQSDLRTMLEDEGEEPQRSKGRKEITAEARDVMRYKYIEELLDGLDMEALVSRLSDLLLSSSSFSNPWDPQSDADQSMQALRCGPRHALLNGGVMSDEMLQKLMREPNDEQAARARIEEMVQKVIEQLTEQGLSPPPARRHRSSRGCGAAPGVGPERPGPPGFEVTDKALDFLGYRALRDLLVHRPQQCWGAMTPRTGDGH